jgi:hypothetical protein
MEPDDLFTLVVDAVRQGLREELGGDEVPLAKRMVGGRVIFEDVEGKRFKEIDAFAFFRKVTAVRERLRVLEQKVNQTDAISPDDRAELQGYITRAYGSLTTFNFLFRDDLDKFRGTGGD